MTEGYILMDPEEFEKYFKEIKPMLKKHIEEPELITTEIYLQIGDNEPSYIMTMDLPAENNFEIVT